MKLEWVGVHTSFRSIFQFVVVLHNAVVLRAIPFVVGIVNHSELGTTVFINLYNHTNPVPNSNVIVAGIDSTRQRQRDVTFLFMQVSQTVPSTSSYDSHPKSKSVVICENYIIFGNIMFCEISVQVVE